MGSAFRQQAVLATVTGQDIRDNVRYTAFSRLVITKIGQPFGEEIAGLHQITRRTAKNLRIPRPAKPLVTLRAVRRHVDKVTFQPPQNIVV
ncbi:hypothetical protein SRABI106_01780 [Rahnella aquatilis]|nr:hypothetical protein SRABI106_01780 [Rahnella aquatilis]